MRILLICMGNICRSPTAEGVLREFLRRHGLDDRVEVDSAGTHGYHVGEPPDPRTLRAAAARGYDLSNCRARKVSPADLEYFDLVLAMDVSNFEVLRRMCPPQYAYRLQMFMSYAQVFKDEEVPDPYYGLGHGFDLVIDMLEDASAGLIKALQKKFAAKMDAKDVRPVAVD